MRNGHTRRRDGGACHEHATGRDMARSKPMLLLYISKPHGSNEQVVARPRAADALGAALRGAFGSQRDPPSDLVQLVERLDRTR